MELVSPQAGPIRFEEFWNLYPRRVAKKDAEKYWSRLSQSQRRLAIDAIPSHVSVWEAEGRSKEYLPYPASWLRGERWTDELEMPKEKIPDKAVAWWASDEGVMAKGKELGIHAKGGEGMAQYKARVVEAARKAA